MVKESSRKCSHCGHNEHNSRTCNGKGIKLFGVKINVSEDDYPKQEDGWIRKSKSLGNLEVCNEEYNLPVATDGYLSDGLIHESSGAKTVQGKMKGKPWSEEEHRSFLYGLEKLGKGDWKGISKNFVHSRTPTQVASHAQKYFLRITATEKKKRRSSVFDIPLNERASASKPSPASTSHITPIPQQATITAQVKTCDRPPLSPRTTNHISDMLRPPYMFGVHNYGQGPPACTTAPNVSFFPTWSYSNSNQHFAGLPTIAAKYTCATSIAHQSSSTFSLFPSYTSPQAGSTNEAATKNGLDLSVQALTL